jgi:hypothetical protein
MENSIYNNRIEILIVPDGNVCWWNENMLGFESDFMISNVLYEKLSKSVWRMCLWVVVLAQYVEKWFLLSFSKIDDYFNWVLHGNTVFPEK